MVRSPVNVLGREGPPGGEITAFGGRVAGADRGHHSARDDRSDARTLTSRLQPASWCARAVISPDKCSMRSSSRSRSSARPSMTPTMRGDRASGGVARCRATQRARPQSLSNGHAPLRQEGANLIDDASALADQSLAYTMQRLQVELFGGFVATNFMVGRWTASAIASASRKSSSVPSSTGEHTSRA